jgi:hypothetical protein
MEKDLSILLNAIVEWYVGNKKKGVYQDITPDDLEGIRKQYGMPVEVMKEIKKFLTTKKGAKYFGQLLMTKAREAGL